MALSKGAALDYYERLYHGSMNVVEGQLVTGVTLRGLVANDTERVVLGFVNLGPTVIVIAPSALATLTRGILLEPNGGSVTFNVVEDALLPTLAWWGIGNGAGGTLYMIGIRRDAAFAPEAA